MSTATPMIESLCALQKTLFLDADLVDIEYRERCREESNDSHCPYARVEVRLHWLPEKRIPDVDIMTQSVEAAEILLQAEHRRRKALADAGIPLTGH